LILGDEDLSDRSIIFQRRPGVLDQWNGVSADLYERPVTGQLEFRRAWLLSLFTKDGEFNHRETLERLYNDLV